MILSNEQINEFEKLAKPLIKWINDNCNPHSKIIIDCSSAGVSSGVCTINTEEFIKD